jgi:hypothetical protein
VAHFVFLSITFSVCAKKKKNGNILWTLLNALGFTHGRYLLIFFFNVRVSVSEQHKLLHWVVVLFFFPFSVLALVCVGANTLWFQFLYLKYFLSFFIYFCHLFI